ncbi:glycosyltransferase family 4 protein [Intrasporangium calvum]|uniref:Glycosyltransferase family 4 protein n=1 Tax=Intrasporangium calvum TaxID=53358 RepID=A0ABT5GCJ5_9MICO|nr:glycosyltransferase family 4 protein [Intrasporangium calvum]MDC5695868.1 glycosyltransferase family 4 protein [Intrasporangium calvum]
MRIAFLNWRDLTHPEGGGAERYAQTICTGLAQLGHDVVLFCAAHPGAPASESLDGYRVVRAGGRLSVYPRALSAMLREARSRGRFDVIIDTQNGLPFWSPLVTRGPVIALVHHVHREQWPVVLGPILARVGWLIESRIAPALYRGRPYVTVSQRSRDELVDLGVAADDIHVIHNGTSRPLALATAKDRDPTLVVLGRLVPHKRVELAVDVVARLRDEFPRLQLRVVGDGWWRSAIERHAAEAGVSDQVHVLGYVDEITKHRELARAWVALAPSAKEGWGLNVVEAASHGVPTIAHHGAGGLSESILDGQTGVLVHESADLAAAAAQLLHDHAERARLGEAARHRALGYTWNASVARWHDLLQSVVAGAETSPAKAERESA